MVAHNGKAFDFNWLLHLNHRYNFKMPLYITWLWDTLLSSKVHPDLKIDNPQGTGKLGNTNHTLPILYATISGEALQGHHDARVDVIAGSLIAKFLMSKRFNKTKYVFALRQFHESKAAKIRITTEAINPTPCGPWKSVDGEIPNTGMPKATEYQPCWGFKGEAKNIPTNIENYFLLFWDEALEKIAFWTNWYARVEPVKLLRVKENREIFERCKLGDKDQRWRVGNAQQREAFKPLTKWHILLVFGTLVRAAVNRVRSLDSLWQEYDNVADPFVKKHIRREKFWQILKYMACCDYSNLEKTEDGTKLRKLARIKPLLNIIEARFRELYDMSQRGAIDEACVVCKSNFAGIKQRNPHKVIRTHLKIFCLGCCETNYLNAFRVYEGKNSGSLKEIIVDDLIPKEYANMSKVITLDNYFTGHNLTHHLYQEHGMYHVGTVTLRHRSDEYQKNITECDFPFRALPGNVAEALPRGFIRVQKATLDCIGRPPYQKHATLVKDSKVLGLSHNVIFGKNKDTSMKRRIRTKEGVKDVEVNSCEALIWYNASYDVVDRIDQAMRTYPIDFRCKGHWYRRLLYWLIDASLHNAWILIQWHMGVWDVHKIDYIAKRKICYCQESHIKNCSRNSGDGEHHCYINRTGLSGRYKFLKDISKAMIARASRELTALDLTPVKPKKRGRKSMEDSQGTVTVEDQPKAKLPKHPNIKHGIGHHQFKEDAKKKKFVRCIVCSRLDRRKLLRQGEKVAKVKTGCSNCSLHNDSSGAAVCLGHWNSRIGREMHEYGFKLKPCMDLLETYIDE